MLKNFLISILLCDFIVFSQRTLLCAGVLSQDVVGLSLEV